MRNTLGFCRSTSLAPMKIMQGRPKRAQTVAVATPCWPAPVSAMIRVLPMRHREQDLADAIVDLVRAGVVELVALEVDLRAFPRARRAMLGQALGEIERAGAADIMFEQIVELAP